MAEAGLPEAVASAEAITGGLAALVQAGALTRTALRLEDPDVPVDRLVALASMLGQLHSSCRFWIGDLLQYAERSEEGSQVEAAFRMNEEWLMDSLRVSRKVSPEIRRPELTWSHHRVVAAVKDVRVQDELLGRAVDEELGVREMRALLDELTELQQGYGTYQESESGTLNPPAVDLLSPDEERALGAYRDVRAEVGELAALAAFENPVLPRVCPRCGADLTEEE